MENTHLLFYRDIESCELVNIVTPDKDRDLIAEIDTQLTLPRLDMPTIRNYTFTLGNNCCPHEVVIVPAMYQLNTTITACSYDETTDTVTYTYNVTGITPSFIQSVQISDDNVTYSNFNRSNLTLGFSFTLEYTVGSTPFPDTKYLRITHIDGFVYTLEFATDFLPLAPCDTVVTQEVTYPAIDPRINIQVDLVGDRYITLVDLFGEVLSGVYNVIICRNYVSSSVCVQNSVFMNCNLICDVIAKLVQCRDSDVMFFYDALVMSNFCNTSYEDKCMLYEMLLLKIESDGCYDPFKDCNCNDNVSGNIYAHRQSNARRTHKKCNTCTS
jgi:hypothetical protein